MRLPSDCGGSWAERGRWVDADGEAMTPEEAEVAPDPVLGTGRSTYGPPHTWISERPPIGHPDYEFPKEVHNLLVTALTTHVTLSAMADSKASILMGATFVVFGLTLGQLTSGNAVLPLPMMMLGLFSFLATVLSVLAIRPKIRPIPPQFRTNMLFFGSFSFMEQDEYIDRMIDLLRSEEEAYRTMARDLYQNGVFLRKKKYKYLGYAYATFLAGIVATFVAFLFELLKA